MSMLFVLTILFLLFFLIHYSVKDLQKKKVQMYKEKYEKALQLGDNAKIIEAGREYHTLLQPKVQPSVIEAFIQKDYTKQLQLFAQEGLPS